MAGALYDTSAVVLNNASGTNPSANFTVGNNANRTLIINLINTNNVGDPSGVTYGGIAMTQITSRSIGGNKALSQWALLDPATGSNSLAVSYSGGTPLTTVHAYSFYNTKRTLSTMPSNTTAGTNSTETCILTTTDDNTIPVSTGFPFSSINSGAPNNQLGTSLLSGWDNVVSPAGTHTVSYSQGGGSSQDGISTLGVEPFPPILFINVSDSITVAQALSMNVLTFLRPNVSDSITVSESVTIHLGTLTTFDFICSLVSSAYKWLTSTLLTAQQNYNVQPYFQVKILDDTVQPNQIIKNGNGGGDTELPLSLGSAVTAPDGSILAAGFDNSNHISFFKAANLHASNGAWDQQTTLDSSASILLPHTGQGRVAISCSEYINGSYHIDVYYFKNFVNDGTDLQIVQQYSDDGGATWNTRTFNLGVANNLYYASSPVLNLSCCAFKPRLVNGVLQSGFAFIRGNGNSFATNASQTQKGYDIFYVTGGVGGFSSNTMWSQKNVDSADWIIQSLDSFYFNNVDYIVFAGFRNFIDAPNTLSTNYSIWLTAGLVLSGTNTKDLWSSPRPIFSSNSVSAINQNNFTYPVATVTNGTINIVFRAITVNGVSQSAQGASSTVVTTNTNYMMVQSVDALNFTYPTIIVFSDGTTFDDTNITQAYNSYTNQGVYFYLLGTGKLWEFIQNNTVADVSGDVVQYSIQESAGQPSALTLQIANQNNMWYPAGTNPGASAVAKNRKVLIQQGYYNANSVPETVPRNAFFIDDITQNTSSNSNNVVISGRDLYKKMKTTIMKYAFSWLGPVLYTDIFDGSTLANWSQVSGTWVETGNTVTTTLPPATDAVLILNGLTTMSYGSMMYVNVKRNASGINHIYAAYIDANNWLRLELNGNASTWNVVRNVAGVKTTLDSGSNPNSGANTYTYIVRRYDYFKFSFYEGTTGDGNAIDAFATVYFFALTSSPLGEYDLTGIIGTLASPQPFGVGFGYNDSGATSGIFSFFKYMQYDNSNNLAELLKALGTKANINKYDIQDLLLDNFYDKTQYTGTFTNLNNRLNLTAGNLAMNNVTADRVGNGEFTFKAKLTPTNGASSYGFKFIFRANGSSSPTSTYYWHVMAASSGGYVNSRFEILYSGTTYPIPAQSTEVTNNPPATPLGSLNFDLTAIHTFKVVMVDGWMFAFIDGVMVNAWNDNNTTQAFLTSGFWGWIADTNTALTVYSMKSTAFWKQIQQFSLNPGDDVESAMLNLLTTLRGWVFSNLMGFLKAVFLSSADASTYTYQNQIFAQGVDASDKEYVSQITVYGDQVSAVARNTTLMAGVAVREEVIVDYTIKTQQDAQTRANNELTQTNQYQGQYNPKQTMNVGAEDFDSVTVVDTGNNTTGINGGSRVYAEKFTVGGSGGGNEFSVEVDTGNL